jgi:SAM-dependent methyltransferase
MPSQTLTLDPVDNNAWYRQIAAGWARRMLAGDLPDTWAQHTDTEVQFAINQLRLRPGDRALDLGCGWGRHSLQLAAYGLRVTGLDLSAELLGLARYHARRQNLPIDWIEADVAHLPVRGGFDAVAQFCSNLMTWFPDRAQTLQALRNVARALRPGGRFVFGTDDWLPDLPPRSPRWDEWRGGAAIYRERFDSLRRLASMQTVIFGPDHARAEYRRQTWWPSRREMETLFADAGLAVWARFNAFVDGPYDPGAPGLVYVLARE